MKDPESFVVKVYRQQGGTLVGTVQEVCSGRTIPFRTKDELWTSLRESAYPSVKATCSRQRRVSGGTPEAPSKRKPKKKESQQ